MDKQLPKPEWFENEGPMSQEEINYWLGAKCDQPLIALLRSEGDSDELIAEFLRDFG